MHTAKLALFVVVSTLLCFVNAQWNVAVTFSNECSESVRIQFEGGDADEVATVLPGNEYTFSLCSYLCTGFLGACEQYPWSYVAEATLGPNCNKESYTWSGSDYEEICGLDAFGSGRTIRLVCSDLVCSSDPTENESNEVTADNASEKRFPSDCLASQISNPPLPSDPITPFAARLAEEVYKGTSELTSLAQKSLGAESVETFADSDTGIFAAAVMSPRSVIIAFRGTETQEKADIDTIANTEIDGAGAHAGFSKALSSIYSEMMSYLNSNIKGSDTVVVVTGHSMGGALATLFAERMTSDSSTEFSIDAVYTFGSPRTGSETWASKYSNLGLDDITLRFVHHNDPIPLVPSPQVGYSHVGRPIFLPQEKDGCTEQSEPDFEFDCDAADNVFELFGQGIENLACGGLLGIASVTTLVGTAKYGSLQQLCYELAPEEYHGLCTETNIQHLYEIGSFCCYLSEGTAILRYHSIEEYQGAVSNGCLSQSSRLQSEECFDQAAEADAILSQNIQVQQVPELSEDEIQSIKNSVDIDSIQEDYDLAPTIPSSNNVSPSSPSSPTTTDDDSSSGESQETAKTGASNTNFVPNSFLVLMCLFVVLTGPI